MDWRGRHVAITGGTSGIGRALVDALVGRGARVLTCGRDAARLEQLTREVPEVTAVVADLSTDAGVDAVVGAAAGWTGTLDVLINNAGYQMRRDLDRDAAAGVAAEVRANLAAPIELSLRLLPSLSSSDIATIVNLTSIVGVAPKGRAPVYSATKAGMRGFTHALRQALAGRGVNVIEALPPLTDTPMATAVPLRKRPPEEFAVRVLSAIERRASRCSDGPNRLWLALDDGVAAAAGRATR